MNSREHTLLYVLLSLVLFVGGGALLWFFCLSPYLTLRDQIAESRDELAKKQRDLTNAEAEAKRLLDRNPRLKEWKKLSLPDLPVKEEGVKTARSPEETKKHISRIQVQYEKELSALMAKSGFSASSIKVNAKPIDSKSSPTIGNKVPVYTRLAFVVQGQGGYAALQKMLQDFHNDVLLHQVRTLNVQRPATGRGPGEGNPGQGGPGRGGPGQGGPGQGGQREQLLDVTMTVEALMVNGAPARASLKSPDLKPGTLKVLAEPARHYPDMLTKNVFYGRRVEETVREDRPKEDTVGVLSFVKLTMIYHDGRRWQATMYDQGKGPPERRINALTLDEYTVFDRYDNKVFESKVEKFDENGSWVILESEGKYYKLLVGDYLFPAIKTPLKDSELKELKIEPKKTAAAKDEKPVD